MKIRWEGQVTTPPEKTASNIAHCKSLGLPEIKEAERPALAVIGGGPSVKDHIEELQHWPGDVWVSGSAYPWAMEHGIAASFFTIDQSECMGDLCRGATHAVVATCCDPSVFETMAGKRVEVFDLHHAGPEANHGATSVTAVPKIALLMGYRDVSFFGCDSSYAKQTHIYYDDPHTYVVSVACNGGTFRTGADMLMQAEFMSLVMRSAPQVFKNRSGGLLKAMVEAAEDLDYDIVEISAQLAEKLKEAA